MNKYLSLHIHEESRGGYTTLRKINDNHEYINAKEGILKSVHAKVYYVWKKMKEKFYKLLF